MSRRTPAEVAALEVQAARKAGWYAQTLDQSRKQGIAGRPLGSGRQFTDEQLAALLDAGMSQKDAAAILGTSAVTVCRRAKALEGRG